MKREQAQKDRMKKRIKKLEKAAPELIPIEDFITPVKYSDSNRSVFHCVLACMVETLISLSAK